MEEPYVGGKAGVKTAVGLKVDEEIFPLLAEAVSDIVPQSLNPGVVNTPNEKDIFGCRRQITD